MFPVAVVTGLGWLFLFLGLLAAPPSPRSRGRGGPGNGSARFAEFDGQVIRQWVVITGDDESPDQYHLAIDDGVRAKAWDLVVGDSVYRQAPPGALVHARVRGWRGGQASVWLVEPTAVARQLPDPGEAWDPRGHSGS